MILYKKAINRLRFFLFQLNELLFISSPEKELKKISKIDFERGGNKEKVQLILKKYDTLFQKYPNHPIVVAEASRFEQIFGSFKNGYSKIKKIKLLKKQWLEKNNIENKNKDEFIPHDQVIGSFGNCLPLHYYLFHRINIEKNLHKPIVLLKDFDFNRIPNKTLYSFFKPYLNEIKSTKLFYKFRSKYKILKNDIESGLPFGENYYPPYAAINFINQEKKKIKNGHFNSFQFTNNDTKKGKEILKNMGVPLDAWYVVLHVRQGKGNELYNADPLTYIPAIKEIISRGGYVFRMGDAKRFQNIQYKMEPLPKIKGLIDYPFTKQKSEFMDIFLAATCRFCIGTTSGFWPVPRFFNKPVLMTNLIPAINYYMLNGNELALPKKIIESETGKLYKLDKQFQIEGGSIISNIQLNSKKLQYVNNTEDEIKLAVVEMFDLLEKKSINNEFLGKNKKVKEKLDILNLKTYEFPLKAMANFSLSYLKQYPN